MKKTTLLIIGILMLIGSINVKVEAQIEPFIGQIILVPYTYAPRGWADCDGRLLPIAQNVALFSLLGTTYGGNGTTDFALPDLRGRVPVGVGNYPGSQTYVLGQMAGAEQVTLTVNQLPAHNHTISAVTSNGNQSTPTSNLPAGTGLLDKEYSNAAADTSMKSTMVGNTGGSQPVSIVQPYTTLRYIIATEGIYPSRP